MSKAAAQSVAAKEPLGLLLSRRSLGEAALWVLMGALCLDVCHAAWSTQMPLRLDRCLSFCRRLRGLQ